MSVVQRKAMLKAEGFFPHKKNAKGTTIIYSRKHPSAKFVRVVVDSGIDSKTGKVVGKVGVKLCFVNRQKSWREITTQIFTTNTGLVKTIRAQEAAEKFVKTGKEVYSEERQRRLCECLLDNMGRQEKVSEHNKENHSEKVCDGTKEKVSEGHTKKPENLSAQ